MLLMEPGADGLPDPGDRDPRPLYRGGSQFVVDTQRLWHVVVHNGTEPRYALISSFESGPGTRPLDRPSSVASPVGSRAAPSSSPTSRTTRSSSDSTE